MERLNNRENAFYRQREVTEKQNLTIEAVKQGRKAEILKKLEKLSVNIRPGIQKVDVPFKNLIVRCFH